MITSDTSPQTSDDPAGFGRAVRKELPRSSHADWSAGADRADPVELIEGQNADRLDFLLPVRRARMAASPFAFFRGAARIMAHDLAAVPDSALTVQLCGDAHLANFGLYASPERRLVFDLTDFDETLPGPFDWDVKRLGASFAIAATHRGFDRAAGRRLAEAATAAYRTRMAELAETGWLDVWYAHQPFAELLELAERRGLSKRELKAVKKVGKKAKSRDRLSAARKLVEDSDAGLRFKSQRPLVIPLRELPEEAHPERREESVAEAFDSYRSSLGSQMQVLLDRYRLADIALKVVGVGSVGTRCSMGLFVGRSNDDVLLLQIKEAAGSVLEEHLPASVYRRHGQRIVEGQRLMQATSDIFLGWCRSGTGREYYWRQLKDWKGSADLERSSQDVLMRYAALCGQTLARSHAVSGDPAVISGYLGKGSVFDRAVGEFAVRYADQNLADFARFSAAVRDGSLEAAEVPM